jgi:hypothetical protein
MSRILALLALAVIAASAQSWTLERVDSASSYGYVQLARASDGTLWLAYVTPDSNIRVARHDTAWSFEDIDTTQLRPNPPYGMHVLSFALDTAGRPAMVVTNRFAELTDTGWVVESLPMTAELPRLSFDPSGRPVVASLDDSQSVGVIWRSAASWESWPTIPIDTGYQCWSSVECVAFHRDGTPLVSYWDFYSMGGMIDWGGWDVFELQGDSWSNIRSGGGLDAGGTAFGVLVDSTDSVHVAFEESGQWTGSLTGYDNDYLDEPTNCGAAALDLLDQPQVAWLASGGIKHGFKTGYWHIGLIPGTSGARWCDLVIGDDGQPVVAFIAANNSVWLARGADIVGVADSPVAVLELDEQPTLVRNSLRLRGVASAELVDIAGRSALRLVPGANDLAGVKPGVYFLRGGAGATTKVIIAR